MQRSSETAEAKHVGLKIPNKTWVHFVAGGCGAVVSALEVFVEYLQGRRYGRDVADVAAGCGQDQVTGRLLSGEIAAAEGGCLLDMVSSRKRDTAFWRNMPDTELEGFRSLFKGLGPNLLGVVPARAINFYAYGNGKRFLSQNFANGEESSLIHLVAAANAGIITATATNPIWLVKTRLQLDKQLHEDTNSRTYKNSIDCIRKVVRNEGISGLYRGLSASYLGVTESTIQWVLYEYLKNSFTMKNSKDINKQSDAWREWLGLLSSAGVAKLFAAVITYPHEVLRTRLRQVPPEGSTRKYKSLLQCTNMVLREEGFTAFYGGLTPHLMRVIPNAIILFGSYELILKLCGV